MRVTSRYWAGVALTGVLTLFALILGRAEPLVGAAGLGAWLVAHQYRFTTQTRRTVEDLSVTQSSPKGRVTKDEPFVVSVTAETSRPSPLDVEVRCEPSVSVVGVTEEGRRCRLRRGEESATTQVTASGVVAGRVSFESPVATLSDPLGFFSETVPVGDSLEIRVESRVPRQLHIGAGGRQVAIGYGERDSVQLETGQEPTEIREYSPGDELRHIDWKATARLGRPHVREYDRKTPRRSSIVVDHRSSMATGRLGERKLDYARDVALLFLNDARTHLDPVSLYTVGDEGVTSEHPTASRSEQYSRLRRELTDLTPTPSGDDGSTHLFETHPVQARRLAARFEGRETRYDRTLLPYVSQRDAYVRRLDRQPFFATVRAHAAELRRSTWTILVTDDTNRSELRDAVKFARRGDGHVAVFITPTVLFEPNDAAESTSTYQRYRDFETFRRKLSEPSGVSAYEVGPDDRLERVLAARRGARRNETNGHRERQLGGVP